MACDSNATFPLALPEPMAVPHATFLLGVSKAIPFVGSAVTFYCGIRATGVIDSVSDRVEDVADAFAVASDDFILRVEEAAASTSEEASALVRDGLFIGRCLLCTVGALAFGRLVVYA